MQVCMREFTCFQISKGANRFELHVQGSEAWIDECGEASRAELEGSIDDDVCTCNWSNLVGHGCRDYCVKRSAYYGSSIGRKMLMWQFDM
jgi:hypothetical protein